MRVAFWILLAGCVDTEPQALPGQQGPPAPLDLWVRHVQRDRPMEAHVYQAAPGSTVVLLGTTQVNGPPACPGFIAPDCLDIAAPYVVLASARADDLGFARLMVDVPPNLPFPEVRLMAGSLNQGTVYMSPGQTHAVTDAMDGGELACPAGPAPVPWTDTELFTDGWPRAIFFRLEGTFGVDYDIWERDFAVLDGLLMKQTREELSLLDPGSYLRVLDYARCNPTKTALLHFNGRSRDPIWRDESVAPFPPLADYSDEHFLFYAGCRTQAALGASDTEICLRDGCAARFQDSGVGLGGGLLGDQVSAGAQLGGDTYDWENAEAMWVSDVRTGACPSAGPGTFTILTVERGQAGTTAQPLPNNSWIVPHHWGGPWATGNLLWQYNLSTLAPADIGGETGSDVLAHELATWLAPGGGLEHLHGLQLDIASWTQSESTNRLLDGDVDGVPELLMSGDEDLYEQGMELFLADLKSQLGPDKLLLADAGAQDSQRAVSFVDGGENEGVSALTDIRFRFWSRGINRLAYWKSRTTGLTYAVHKFSQNIAAPPNALDSRLAMAAATAIDIPVAMIRRPFDTLPMPGGCTDNWSRLHWDELVRGEARETNWLGDPVAPAQFLALAEPDLWAGDYQHFDAGDASQWQERFQAQVSANNGALRIDSTGDGVVRLPFQNHPGGDLTVSITLRAQEHIGFQGVVPRRVYMQVSDDAGMLLGDAAENDTYADESAFTARFTFRDIPAGSGWMRLKVEGEGWVEIDALSMHASPDVILREYDRGVVIANPSNQPVTVDLNGLTGNRLWRRLDASVCQAADGINDGSPVGSSVTVDGRSGLFLQDGLIATF